MVAKVLLVLNGLIYCKKGEIIQMVELTKKYTIFERSEEQRDSKGKKIIISRKFMVANDLVRLYFN